LQSYCESYFPLIKRLYDSKGNDVGCKLHHLQAVQKMTGITPQELDFVLPVDDVCYLLEYFYSVKTAKGEKITYTELKAFSEMNCINLDSFEVSAIMLIDRIFEAKTT